MMFLQAVGILMALLPLGVYLWSIRHAWKGSMMALVVFWAMSFAGVLHVWLTVACALIGACGCYE